MHDNLDEPNETASSVGLGETAAGLCELLLPCVLLGALPAEVLRERAVVFLT